MRVVSFLFYLNFKNFRLTFGAVVGAIRSDHVRADCCVQLGRDRGPLPDEPAEWKPAADSLPGRIVVVVGGGGREPAASAAAGQAEPAVVLLGQAEHRAGQQQFLLQQLDQPPPPERQTARLVRQLVRLPAPPPPPRPQQPDAGGNQIRPSHGRPLHLLRPLLDPATSKIPSFAPTHTNIDSIPIIGCRSSNVPDIQMGPIKTFVSIVTCRTYSGDERAGVISS